MQDLGIVMKHLGDTVAAKLSNHAEMVALGVALNSVANITQPSARTNLVNSLVQALLGDFAQALRQHRGFAGKEHLAGIAMIAIFYDGDVDVNRIAVFELFAVAGNTMTDDMIHASTDGLGKGHLAAAAAVIERRRDAIQFIDNEVMANLIKLFGRDARLNVLTDHFQYRRCCAAGSSHAL